MRVGIVQSLLLILMLVSTSEEGSRVDLQRRRTADAKVGVGESTLWASARSRGYVVGGDGDERMTSATSWQMVIANMTIAREW